MSQRQKQENLIFIRKSGGQLGKPSSSTDISVPTPSDQLMASFSQDSAGYKLRSMDKQLAQLILDKIPLLDSKLQKTLRGVAVSRKFRNFETLVEKDPSLALRIMGEKLPEVMKTAPFNSLFVAPVAPVNKAAPVDKVAPVDPVLSSEVYNLGVIR